MTAGLWDGICGNDELKQYFEAGIARGSLVHAYLLEGGKGSGRHSLVTAVATALAGNDPLAFKIGLGLCPDFITVKLPEGKKSIGVEQVREMREKAMLRPNDLSFKVFLVENADCMTVPAQNAALKIFEEPPKDVYFFLLCENSGLLLPTVRSRMHILRMERFGREALEGYLAEKLGKSVSAGRMADAIRHCDGWLGQALEKCREAAADTGNAGRQTEDAIVQLLEKLSQKDFPGVLSAVLGFPGGKDRAKMIEALIRAEEALRDILRARLMPRDSRDDGELFFFCSPEAARSCARMLPNRSLILLFDRIGDAVTDLQRNANLSLQKNLLATDLMYAAAGQARGNER